MSGEIQDIAVRTVALGVPRFVADMNTAADSIDRVEKSHGKLSETAEKADLASSGFASFASRIGGVGTSVEQHGKRLDKFGKRLTEVGVNMSMWTLPLLAGLNTSVKAFGQFQEALSLVQRQANASGRDIVYWGKSIQKLGPQYGNPVQLAQAMYYPGSSFSDESERTRRFDAMRALKASAMLARIGDESPVDSAQALMSVINAGLRGTSKSRSFANYQRIASAFDQAVGQGHMHLGDLLSSFSTEVLPEAKSAGMSLQGILAYTSDLTRVGVPARVANSLVKLTITRMLAPTKQGISALEQIGYANPYALGDMLKKTGNFSYAFRNLQQHLAYASPDERKGILSAIFGGSRGFPNAEALLGALGRYNGILRVITQNSTVGAFQKHFREAQGTQSGREQNFQNQLSKTEIQFGRAEGPVFLSALSSLTKAIETTTSVLHGLPGPVRHVLKDLVVALPALAAGTVVLGPLARTMALIARGGGKGLRGLGWLLGKMGKDDLGDKLSNIGGKGNGGLPYLRQIALTGDEQVGLLRQIALEGGFGGGQATWQKIADDADGEGGAPLWDRIGRDGAEIGLAEDAEKSGGALARIFGSGGKLGFVGDGFGSLSGRLGTVLPMLGEGQGLAGSLGTILPMLGEGAGLAGALGTLTMAVPELTAVIGGASLAWKAGTGLGDDIAGVLGLGPAKSSYKPWTKSRRGQYAKGNKVLALAGLLEKNHPGSPAYMRALAGLLDESATNGHVPYKDGKLYLGKKYGGVGGWVTPAQVQELLAPIAGVRLPGWVRAPHLFDSHHEIPKTNARTDMASHVIEEHIHVYLGGKEIKEITRRVNAETRHRMNHK